MSSDNPCEKPDIEVLTDTGIIEDCHIPKVPPPFMDCKDIEIGIPGLTDGGSSSTTGGGGGGNTVHPVILITDMEDCSATVKWVLDMGSGPVPTGDPFTAYAIQEGCNCGIMLAGTITWVVKSETTGRWEFVHVDATNKIAFELTNDMDVTSATVPFYASATVLQQGSGGVFTATAASIYVYDMFGKYKCAQTGDRGYAGCSKLVEDGVGQYVWEIYEMHSTAKRVEISISSALSYSDATATASVTGAIDGTDVEGPITVNNTMGWSTEGPSVGIAYLNSDCEWVIEQLTCDEIW